MTRPLWKGNIAFGLVNIPIVIFSAENASTHIRFRQIDRRDNARIQYKRINSRTGREVPWEETGKGYEYDREHIIPVREKELEKIPGVEAKTIPIDSFVDAKNIQPIDIDRTCYLVPDKGGEKGYVLLREALEKTGTVGIAKILISTREYLAAVGALGKTLVVYLLHYATDIRKPEDLPFPEQKMEKQKISAKEREIAVQLIQSMKTPWRPSHYQDAFLKKFNDWLSKKLRHVPVKKSKKQAAIGRASPITDFVALMRESLKKRKPGRQGKKKVGVAVPAKKRMSHAGRALH